MSPHSHRSLFRRQARAFVVTWTGALASGCVPGSSANREAVAALDREVFTDPNGNTISYLRAGKAGLPRIVYVHGTPGDATAFGWYLVRFIDGHESFSIDRPGFGASAASGPVVGFAEQAEALEPLLVAEDGRLPILVGHSLGGPIVAEAAARFPEKVGAIVIISGSLDPSLEEPKWFNSLADTLVFRALLPKILVVSNDEILAAPAETKRLADRLAMVRCPVWIIHGTDDGLVPYGNVAYMKRAFVNSPRVRTFTLRGDDHFIPWTREAEIRSVIEEAALDLSRRAGSGPEEFEQRRGVDRAAGR